MTPPAPNSAKAQVARLLTLVPYLHARGSVRVDEAAADLGVTPAQLVSDLKVLFMCGLPGGYPDDLIDVDLDALEGEEGDGVIRVSNADYLARPLQLSPTEATALIVALRAHAQRRRRRHPRGRRPHARQAARPRRPGRPRPAAGPRRRAGGATRARSTAPTSSGPPREQRQVRLTYYVPARDEESERVVDPRGVVTAHGFAYLDAYCHSAEAPRLFRLDRIHGRDGARHADPDPRRGAPRPGRRDSSTGRRTRRPRRCGSAPPARWIVEYYPVEEVRQREDGGLDVDLLVADERWLHRLLLRLAPNAQVIAPREFADAFTAKAQEALRLYA